MPNRTKVFGVKRTCRIAKAAPAAQRFYDLRRWCRTSHQVLADVDGEVYPHGGPLCRQCLREGRTTPADQVDHVDPHDGDEAKKFDPDNLESACATCHGKKTRRQRLPSGSAPT